MKITSEQAQAAAAWWTERITNVQPFDNGSMDLASVFANSLATRLARETSPSPEVAAAFRFELAKLIEASEEHYLVLDVDYGPSGLLRDAATTAGVDRSCFPIKTTMWFDRGGVQVRAGYRARRVDVFGDVETRRCLECGGVDSHSPRCLELQSGKGGAESGDA